MKRLHHAIERLLPAQGWSALVRSPFASGTGMGGVVAGLQLTSNGTVPGEGSA